jgi:hypothetical protein
MGKAAHNLNFMSQSITATARIVEIVTADKPKANGRTYQVLRAMITSGAAKGTKVLANRTLGTNPLTGKPSNPCKVEDVVILHGRVFNNSIFFDVQKQQSELTNSSDDLFSKFGLKKTVASVGAEAKPEVVVEP